MSSRALASALGDRYTVERELGAGGMATVYLASLVTLNAGDFADVPGLHVIAW